MCAEVTEGQSVCARFRFGIFGECAQEVTVLTFGRRLAIRALHSTRTVATFRGAIKRSLHTAVSAQTRRPKERGFRSTRIAELLCWRQS